MRPIAQADLQLDNIANKNQSIAQDTILSGYQRFREIAERLNVELEQLVYQNQIQTRLYAVATQQYPSLQE